MEEVIITPIPIFIFIAGFRFIPYFGTDAYIIQALPLRPRNRPGPAKKRVDSLISRLPSSTLRFTRSPPQYFGDSHFTTTAYGKWYGCSSMFMKGSSNKGKGKEGSKDSDWYLVYCAPSSTDLNFAPLRCAIPSSGGVDAAVCTVVDDMGINLHVPNIGQPHTRPAMLGGFRGSAMVPMPPNTRFPGSGGKEIQGVHLLIPSSGSCLVGIVVKKGSKYSATYTKATSEDEHADEAVMPMQIPSLTNAPWHARTRLFDVSLEVPSDSALIKIAPGCAAQGLGMLSFLHERLAPAWRNEKDCPLGQDGVPPMTFTGAKGAKLPCSFSTYKTTDCVPPNTTLAKAMKAGKYCCKGNFLVPFVEESSSQGGGWSSWSSRRRSDGKDAGSDIAIGYFYETATKETLGDISKPMISIKWGEKRHQKARESVICELHANVHVRRPQFPLEGLVFDLRRQPVPTAADGLPGARHRCGALRMRRDAILQVRHDQKGRLRLRFWVQLSEHCPTPGRGHGSRPEAVEKAAAGAVYQGDDPNIAFHDQNLRPDLPGSPRWDRRREFPPEDHERHLGIGPGSAAGDHGNVEGLQSEDQNIGLRQRVL